MGYRLDHANMSALSTYSGHILEDYVSFNLREVGYKQVETFEALKNNSFIKNFELPQTSEKRNPNVDFLIKKKNVYHFIELKSSTQHNSLTRDQFIFQRQVYEAYADEKDAGERRIWFVGWKSDTRRHTPGAFDYGLDFSNFFGLDYEKITESWEDYLDIKWAEVQKLGIPVKKFDDYAEFWESRNVTERKTKVLPGV